MSTTSMVRGEDEIAKSHVSVVVPRRSDQIGARVQLIQGPSRSDQRQFLSILRDNHILFSDPELQRIVQIIHTFSSASNYAELKFLFLEQARYIRDRNGIISHLRRYAGPRNADENYGSDTDFRITTDLRQRIHRTLDTQFGSIE